MNETVTLSQAKYMVVSLHVYESKRLGVDMERGEGRGRGERGEGRGVESWTSIPHKIGRNWKYDNNQC